MNMLRLFTSPTCPHCPAMKRAAEGIIARRDDTKLKIIQSGMKHADTLFTHYGIKSVPTIIITGPGYPHNIGLQGSQAEQTIEKYLDIAAGKRDVEEKTKKPGLLKRLLGKTTP